MDILNEAWKSSVKEWHKLLSGNDKNTASVIIAGADIHKETAERFSKIIAKTNMSAALQETYIVDAWRFSGFKTYRMFSEVKNIAYQGKNLLPVSKLIAKSDKIYRRYNITYMRAEIQQANNAALSAERWHSFADNTDRYYLQYRTAGDERVRDDHRILNGTTLPKNHDFWKEFYPPNGWGCRCSVVEVLASRYKESKVTDKKIDIYRKKVFKSQNAKPFAFNPGAELKLFPENISYYKVTDNIFNIIKRTFKDNAYYLKYTAKNNSKVYVNLFADKQDFNENFKYAKIIANELNIDVKIRPHYFIQKVKNPEYEINGLIGYLKSATSKSSIHNLIRIAKNQGCDFIVFNLNNFTGDFNDAKRNIKGKIYNRDRYKDVFKFFILIKKGKVEKVTITEILYYKKNPN